MTPGGTTNQEQQYRSGYEHASYPGSDAAGCRYTRGMGLTLHYQGQLASEAAYATFIAQVTAFAAARQWPAHAVSESYRELLRSLQPEDPEAEEVEELYAGPVRGLILLPHPECEPLVFEFDTDLFLQDTCKTQFAGPTVHAQIVELFRQAESGFALLDVQDEAGFWEVGDTAASRAALVQTFAETRAAIDEAAADTAGAQVCVITPSGRILDILAG